MRLPFVILLLLACVHSIAQDSRVHVFHTSNYWQNLDSVVKLFPGDLPDSAVLAGKYDAVFKANAELTPQEQQNPKYWLMFRLKAADNVKGWQLLLTNGEQRHDLMASHDTMTAYYLASDRQLKRVQRSGLLVARSEKSIQGSAGLTAVDLTTHAGEELLVYIKISDRFAQHNRLSHAVIRHPAMETIIDPDSSMLWALFAIALVFSALSFFFFFFVREKAYLFFGLYALLLSQHYLILQPELTFINWYIPETPRLVIPAWTLLTIGGFALFAWFGRVFINLPSLSRQTDEWFRGFLLLFLVALATELGWFFLADSPYPFQPVSLLIVAITLGFFIRFVFFPNILARIFVAGAAWLMLFTIAGMLWGAGKLQLPFNPWPVAQVGQFLIFAMALAYKVRLNEKARASAARITEMDKLKSRFFANISHEFRTPLTLIQGPLQQAMENANENNNGSVPMAMRQLKTMRRNTDRLLELVNQLLDLSRLDAGNMQLRVVRGDVLQLLQVLAASFESMAERRQVHFHIHIPQQTSIVFFDKDKLEKIFTNLLANAFKYTPLQGAISVSAEILEGRLRFSIEDNGPGIPKKELDKVFDRFYQVEQTGDNGSGIGLALVKELVDLYRGQVSVNSEAGKGTRFRVSLPVNKDAFKEDELLYGEWKPDNAQAVSMSFAGEEMNDPGLAKIPGSGLPLLLVVEDNAELRRFLQETLEKEYQVICAGNGQEGLDKAIAEVPDIIISDVMMPVMDGFVLTSKLKQDERTSHIPVILLTARAGQQHLVEGLQTGADDYLSKPFDSAELLVRAANLVKQRKLLQQKFAVSLQLRPGEILVKSIDEQFLVNIMQAIEDNMEEEGFGVEELARAVAMSRSQLHRKLVALIGQAPSELIRQTRLLRAHDLLQKKAFSPSEVAFKVGFSSHTYFSKCFKEQFGMSPGELKGDMAS